MSAPGVTFQLLDGRQAAACADEMLALRAEACPGTQADPGEDAARRLRVWRRQPGFALAVASHGGYLVGYACGAPLRPSTAWWRELTTSLPDDVTTEHPGRTFAVTEILVRASWRRQGIARSLQDLLLRHRTEERATLTVAPRAAAAQHAFRNWGWQKIARTRGPDPGTPVLDVLLIGLPVNARTWLPERTRGSSPGSPGRHASHEGQTPHAGPASSKFMTKLSL